MMLPLFFGAVSASPGRKVPVIPVFVAKRQSVQFVLDLAPVWKESTHQVLKTGVMRGLEQVRELMDQDVLQALGRLFR